jgi:4-hydroxyphenylpyruvate dioxygenase
MSTESMPAPVPDTAANRDFMPLHGIDHVEIYVGNAAQAAYFYTRALGFEEVAYAGLHTGVRDRVSHVLRQGRIRLVLTGALRPDHEIARHTARHGDGVKVIALSVPDAEYAYRTATARGAQGVREPWEATDEHGAVRMATVATYGETLHTFVERSGYRGAFLPGYAERGGNGGTPTGLLAIDHIVGNVELGDMEPTSPTRRSPRSTRR